MTPLQTILIAFAALARTKTRSFLTVLGVIIGVGAVIAMVSIGEGAKARVAATFENMGVTTLSVSSGSSRSRRQRRAALATRWKAGTAGSGSSRRAARKKIAPGR